MSETKKAKWTIDRHIPVALICTLILQAAAFIVWATRIDSSVESNNLRIAKLESWKDERTKDSSVLLQRITSTENKVEYLGKNMDEVKKQTGRIEDKLDRVIGRK